MRRIRTAFADAVDIWRIDVSDILRTEPEPIWVVQPAGWGTLKQNR